MKFIAPAEKFHHLVMQAYFIISPAKAIGIFNTLAISN